MIGKLASVKNGPERNVKLIISQTEVFSEISSPSGSYDPRNIHHYEISGLEETDSGLVTLAFVLTDQRRVRFYSTEQKVDMVLLLDQLDGTIGPRKRELSRNKGKKIRRRLTGVLCGCIDAFVSRNSDYDGYWILGLLVREVNEVSFDLLRSNSEIEKSPVLSAVAQTARSNFGRHLEKSGIPAVFVSEGKVVMSRLEPARGAVNGRPSNGHLYLLQAEATSDLGKKYTAHKRIFIAPHDPLVEHRSTRRNG